MVLLCNNKSSMDGCGDYSDIKHPFRGVIVSKSNSGKSVLAKDILRDLLRRKEIEDVVVLSSTCEFNDDWGFIPPDLVSDWSDETLERILDDQKAAKRAGRAARRRLIIVDDVPPSFTNSKLVAGVYSAGRHLNLSILTLCQYSKQLPPTSRTNVSWWFIREQNATGLAAVYESLIYPGTLTEFQAYIAERTQRVGAYIAYDNTTQDPKKRWRMVQSTRRSFRLARRGG